MGGHRRYIAFAIALALNGATSATGSPWGRPAHSYLLISKFQVLAADGTSQSRQQGVIETYGEYGLGGGVTLGGKFGQVWQDIDQPQNPDRRTGVSDAELFLQFAKPLSQSETGGFVATLVGPTGTQSTIAPRDDSGRGMAIQVATTMGTSGVGVFASRQNALRLSVAGDALEVRSIYTLGVDRGEGRLWIFDAYGYNTWQDQGSGKDHIHVLTLAPSYVRPITKKHRLQIGALAQRASYDDELGVGAFISLWYEP